MKTTTKKTIKTILFTLLIVALTACGSEESNSNGQKKEEIVFGNGDWDSVRFHTALAQYIVENGYGYETDAVTGSTPITLTGLKNGDVDAYMEVWTGNSSELYDEIIESGEVVELGVNFDDNAQGFYVPTFVIEGDDKRGIDPIAPDLKTVADLAKYPELFQDPENPDKGRIMGGPSGWDATMIMEEKVSTYGLDDKYNFFKPGSAAALAASIETAFQKGEPWVGYYWEPTWITGKYDLTLLEEPQFSQEKWDNGYGSEFPPNEVVVAATQSLPERAPEVAQFLTDYQSSSLLTAEALAYMQENDAQINDAVIWFLEEKEDVWTTWVDEEVEAEVKDSLQ
ncbi:ABC transporter substrate-binding protein [Salirhabdus salicampi]|uniref:ABC transporter substrate-binding protein n=1 Tax=Salirhabdus salicampi TaxID=476102 RepID=UPI0020C456C3|nr:ABC transporter substrate-binding protein [Salirhabdus salicampi]MCP8617261.1 ABC transporter substrate-binding protein [Salirhabdus salicampi]